MAIFFAAAITLAGLGFIVGKPIRQLEVEPTQEPRATESELVDYLIKYGYLKQPDHRIGNALSMKDLRVAIKKLQRIAGLKETGDISDLKTLAMVKKPRCGVQDFGPSDIARRKKRYALEGSYWRKTDLTYRIEKYSNDPDLKKEDVDKTFEKALEMWSSVSGLTFKRENDLKVEPDIRVLFVTGYHNDSRPADGPGGELAHAFFPGPDNTGLDGDIHLDDDEKFTINGGNGVDLLWVMAHELGHSLGLDHAYHPDSVMFAFYTGHIPDLKLDSDDIEGIRKIYGLPGLERVTPSPQPTPKTCSNVKPDAVVTTADKRTYIFSGAHFWEVKDTGGADGPFEIKDYWRDLEENIDAAYTVQAFGQTIFIKGDRFWVFKNKDLFYGPANIQQLGLTKELANMDAALEWKRNGKIYFFKGSKYWRYDRTRSKLDEGYPRDISIWKGIPNNINAVFQWKNGRTYFFKDDKYYAFNDYLVKVLEDSNNPYPRDVASYWMGCTNPEVNIDPAVGAAYGVLSNVIVLITCFLVTWLF